MSSISIKKYNSNGIRILISWKEYNILINYYLMKQYCSLPIKIKNKKLIDNN